VSPSRLEPVSDRPRDAETKDTRFTGSRSPEHRGEINQRRIPPWGGRYHAKVVAPDPRHCQTAAKADEWIRIRPGTDLASMLALRK
jgi:formylmethanofuran dehydrogenase subunit B